MDVFKNQESLQPYFQTAYGCAVFETIAKGGMGIGGAGGQGDVYVFESGNEKKVGKSTMMQVSFGFQFGGQIYSEIIFFETEKDFKNFTEGNFEFGADINAVALTASASAKASTMGNQNIQAGLNADQTKMKELSKYTKGLAVFTVARGGLMYQASVSGQKFSYKAIEAE